MYYINNVDSEEMTMTVFEVIGKCGGIDWGSSSERHSLGLFDSKEKAEADIARRKEDKEWRWDWAGFEVVEREVI